MFFFGQFRKKRYMKCSGEKASGQNERIRIFMKSGSNKLLVIICIMFLISGTFSLAVAAAGIWVAAKATLSVGILHTFVSLITSAVNLAYSLSVILIGIWALMKTRLEICFNIGVVLTLWAIISMTIFFSNSFIHSSFSIISLISSAVNIVMPLLFTVEIDRLMKYRKNNPETAVKEVHTDGIQNTDSEN